MWDERKEKVMWQNDSLNYRVPSSEVKLYDCYANKIRKTILIISPRTIEKDKKSQETWNEKSMKICKWKMFWKMTMPSIYRVIVETKTAVSGVMIIFTMEVLRKLGLVS